MFVCVCDCVLLDLYGLYCTVLYIYMVYSVMYVCTVQAREISKHYFITYIICIRGNKIR